MSVYNATVQKEIKSVGAKAYFTKVINARLKSCTKGHWLSGYIVVTESSAQAAEMSYELQPNGMVRIYA